MSWHGLPSNVLQKNASQLDRYQWETEEKCLDIVREGCAATVFNETPISIPKDESLTI